MRSQLHFLIFFRFIFVFILAAHSQCTSEWVSSKKIKTELLQINDRISLLAEEIANLKSSEWDSQRIKTQFINMNEKYAYLSQQIVQLKELFESKKTEKKVETTSVSSPTLPPNIRTHLNSSPENYYEREPDLTWTIPALKNKSKDYFELLSHLFPLKHYSMEAQARLWWTWYDGLAISLSYKRTSHDGSSKYLALIPGVTYTFTDQQPHRLLVQVNNEFGEVARYETFQYATRITLMEDTADDEDITVRVHVEPPEDAVRGFSYDGILDGEINNLGLKREKSNRMLVWFHTSPYFFTGPKGYKVRAEIAGRKKYGDEEKVEVAVKIRFLTGPNDADLSRPFKHRATVTIFHATDPTKHLVQSVKKDLRYATHYAVRIGTQAEIDDCLSSNHTLYYRVQISPV